MSIEQDARKEAIEVARLTGQSDDTWFIDLLTVKLVKWHRMGGIASLEVVVRRPKCDGHHAGPRCADPECWNDKGVK